MKSLQIIETCKYLAIVTIITITFYTILIIFRSLNWQSNILRFITLREGFSSDDDSDDEDDDEIEEEFNPDVFREKARKLLDLYEEIEETQGKLYLSTLNKTAVRDLHYVKSLWDEEEDEWKEKAYTELAESKFKKYNLTMMSKSNMFDKIIEKAETKESYKKKYDNMKELYGETGVRYIKRTVGIILDKEMDMDTNLGKKSSFF